MKITTLHESYTWPEMAAILGKSVPYARNLLIQLGVEMPRRVDRYPERVLAFLRRIIALRTFTVPIDDIAELYRKEHKILLLLHMDALGADPFWFVGAGEQSVRSGRQLLLTGHTLDFDLTAGPIQCNLDFRVRSGELFSGREMGDDLRAVADLYLRQLRKIDSRVKLERPILLDALAWVGQGFIPRPPTEPA